MQQKRAYNQIKIGRDQDMFSRIVHGCQLMLVSGPASESQTSESENESNTGYYALDVLKCLWLDIGVPLFTDQDIAQLEAVLAKGKLAPPAAKVELGVMALRQALAHRLSMLTSVLFGS
jgi:hypothetical protein